MKFKKLEITGFKSFFDRTHFYIENENISAIKMLATKEIIFFMTIVLLLILLNISLY